MAAPNDPWLGYRFRPDEKAMISVLVHKESGQQFDISPYVVDLDLYGPEKEPWKVFSGEQEIWELKRASDLEQKVREKYILTKLSRTESGVSRTAGAGIWVEKGEIKDVVDEGLLIGHRRRLTYEYCGGDGADEDRSYYYLHEYWLCDEFLQALQVPRSDYVLCRVFKDLSKPCKIAEEAII